MFYVLQISEKIGNYDLDAFDAEKTINELTESALEHIPALTTPPIITDPTNATDGLGSPQVLANPASPVPPPAQNDRPKVANNNSLRNMRSNSLPVNWQGQAQDPSRTAYQSQLQNQRQFSANPSMLFNNNNNNNNTSNMNNCAPMMQQRQNGGRYSYSSNQDFVNYNHNYANFRQNNNNAQQYQLKNSNGQHFQGNGQFHEQGSGSDNGNNGYYNDGPDVYLQRFHRAAANNAAAAAGQGNAHGMAAYNNGGYYNNGGCNNQQCGQQQCGQQHNGYYGGYNGNKFNNYPRPNATNVHQPDQQQHSYYMDLDRKHEDEVAEAAGPSGENASFQSPQAPQAFDGSNNMVLKDMSTSLSSLYDENTFFQMSTVFSES